MSDFAGRCPNKSKIKTKYTLAFEKKKHIRTQQFGNNKVQIQTKTISTPETMTSLSKNPRQRPLESEASQFPEERD